MFTPEFRNRLDAVVSFAALDEAIILRVVGHHCRPRRRIATAAASLSFVSHAN